MKSVLITGSNRGIGLGLVKKIASLTHPPEHIFATCRNPSNAKVNKKLGTKKLHKSVITHFHAKLLPFVSLQELQDLAKSHNNIHVVGFGKILQNYIYSFLF